MLLCLPGMPPAIDTLQCLGHMAPPCGFPSLTYSSLGQMLLSLGAHGPLFVLP